MALTMTGINARPAVLRATSETASARRLFSNKVATHPLANDIETAELQGFGDTDYHLLRSHALLAHLERIVNAR
ncbi:MAG: hypothetical protein WCP07_13400 [bacterium]